MTPHGSSASAAAVSLLLLLLASAPPPSAALASTVTVAPNATAAPASFHCTPQRFSLKTTPDFNQKDVPVVYLRQVGSG
jgi:hypothetical protein